MTRETTTNDGSAIVTYNVQATSDVQIIVDSVNNGAAGSHPNGTLVNGDQQINLPQASTFTGYLQVAVKTRGPSNNNRTYMMPYSGDTIGGSAALNASSLNTAPAGNGTTTLISDGVSNWYYVGSH